jgi:hypothetical protein
MAKIVAKDEVSVLLSSSPDKSVSKLADDARLVQALTNVLNATLEIAEELPQTKGQLALTIAKKGHAVASVGSSVGSSSKNLEAANMVAGQTLKTIGLVKVAGMTPAKAATFITFAMAEKIALAAGLAEFDKCKTAVASLAATSGLAVLGSASGVGAVIGALAVASDAFNVYAQCYGEK